MAFNKVCTSYHDGKCTENEDAEDDAPTEIFGRLSLPNDPRLKVCRKNTRLLDAIENCDIQRIERLLKLDANPNATCQINCISACHLAAMIDNESLSMLIAAGAQSFRTDKFGRVPLHLAAWAGRPRQIAVLLNFPEYIQDKIALKISPKIELEIKNLCVDKKHLINIPCKVGNRPTVPDHWNDSVEHNCSQFNKNMLEFTPGWTALHLACARAHCSCVQLLLATGADFNALDVNGRTPLDVVGAAYYLGFTIDIHEFNDTIRIITGVGGQIKKNANETSTESTLLHTAVELESKEVIKDLLKSGVSPICLNSDGLTALHICVKKNLKVYLQLIAYFEYSNQDTQVQVADARDKNGLTVLGAAVKAEWIDGVRIVLGAGANVFIQDHKGDSPFHSAAALGNVEIFRTLLTVAKYAIDTLNKKGQTALFIAVAHNHLDIVKLLVSNGASLSNNRHNLNVLHVAAENGHTKILSFLLSCDVCNDKYLIDVITAVSCRTPLFCATVNNHPKCVSLLLTHGALMNFLLPYKNSTGEIIHTTVLHIAAAENYVEIAKMLLETDTRIINTRNSLALLPLHEACIHSNRDIISLLLLKGADLSAEHIKVKTPIQMLMNNLSKPTTYLEEIFDSCITGSSLEMQDKTYEVEVDYRILLPNVTEIREVKVIKAIVDTGNRYCQKRLLQHPLVESFLYLKWKSLLPFFYLIVGLYGCFILSFNMYVMSLFYDLDIKGIQIENEPILYQRYFWQIITYATGAIVIIQIVFMKIIIEKSYFLFLETWTNCIATALAMCLPTLVSITSSESEFMRAVACIAVLLSWLEMMFLLCRFSKWGFYVLMFEKVTAKVIKILLTFGFLIVGFSICFMIQFRRKFPFETLWASVSKTLVMMTSEYDYTSTIDNTHTEDAHRYLSILRLMFIAFVILASIVLMNLMIGVAVNDVNNLEVIGNQRRLEKQVDFLSTLEGAYKYARKIFPKRYCNVAVFKENKVITLSPHRPTCKYYKILPMDIREAIFEKAHSQKKQIGDLCSLALERKLEVIQCAIARQDERIEQFREDIMKLINDKIKSLK